VNPAGVAAAFCDWNHAGIALHVDGGREAFALFAEGDEEPWSEDGPGGGEAVEDGEVGMVGACSAMA